MKDADTARAGEMDQVLFDGNVIQHVPLDVSKYRLVEGT